ncbi:MAG: pantoate--beta-alanine ligase [Gemmatimonadaceae bacterium]
MKIIRTIADLRAELAPSRKTGQSIGLVPTMGFFHEGHRSLMVRSTASCDVTVVTLFVNPTQFNDARDLEAYPRDEKKDAAIAEDAGVDYLFAPDAREMYSAGHSTVVSVKGLTESLEGAARGTGHFDGVATVVAKLFNIAQPDVAFFGQKDAQQALVVKKMVRDLDLPIRIEVCPTVREADGLAMSSRNVRLKPEERAKALVLRAGLNAVLAAITAGERRASAIEAAGRAAMEAMGVKPEYLAARAAGTLLPMSELRGEVLIAVAARVGEVRLIDNEFVSIE